MTFIFIYAYINDPYTCKSWNVAEDLAIRSLLWWTIINVCGMSSHSINIKQSWRDKYAISVKVSSECWISSIISNTEKFVRKTTACFDVNRMTLISCPLQLLPMGNLLTLKYYKTFAFFNLYLIKIPKLSSFLFELHTV